MAPADVGQIAPVTDVRGRAVRRLVERAYMQYRALTFEGSRSLVLSEVQQSVRMHLIASVDQFQRQLVHLNADRPSVHFSNADFEDAIHLFESECVGMLGQGSAKAIDRLLDWATPNAHRSRPFVLRLVCQRRKPTIGRGRTGLLIGSECGLLAAGFVMMASSHRDLARKDGRTIHLAHYGLMLADAALGTGFRPTLSAQEKREQRREILGEIGATALSDRHRRLHELKNLAGQEIHRRVVEGHRQKAAIHETWPLIHQRAVELGIKLSEERYLYGPTAKVWHAEYRRERGLPIGRQGNRGK